MIRLAAAIVLAAGVVTACSSQPAATAPAAVSAAAAADTTTTAEAKPKTAEEITQALAQRIPSLTLTKAFTEADDPNHLLGRPNGYTSKTAFADSRVPEAEVEFAKPTDTERGGGVETFADEAGAKARMDKIQGIGKEMSTLAEYDYQVGGVLLRVSKILTPEQAKEYETALQAILG